MTRYAIKTASALIAASAALTCAGCGSTPAAKDTPMAIVTIGSGSFILSPTAGTGTQSVDITSPGATDAFLELTCRSTGADRPQATAEFTDLHLNQLPKLTVTCARDANDSGYGYTSSRMTLPTRPTAGVLTVSTSDPQVTWIVAVERANAH